VGYILVDKGCVPKVASFYHKELDFSPTEGYPDHKAYFSPTKVGSVQGKVNIALL